MGEENIIKEEMIINFGPQHPSTHGVARLVGHMDGERCIKIEPVIGYLHRGIEKLSENRTHLQIIPLLDRMDYISSMQNHWGFILAVEELMEIKVPERAEYIRIIVSEIQRIANHLLSTASFGADLGAWTVMMYGFREREMMLDLLEMVAGQRMLYNYMRIGGVKDDLPEGFEEKCRENLDKVETAIEGYKTYFYNNMIFDKRTKGVGKMTPEEALNYGITGPMLRATGVPYDLRRDDPYSIYDRFEFDIITENHGDVWDRFHVRFREMFESIKIVRQALDGLPQGEIKAKVPKVLKTPEGEVYTHIEHPKGELAYYLISKDKGTGPYRLKIRTPSFCNLSGFGEFAKGSFIADMFANFASLDIVLGDVDR